MTVGVAHRFDENSQSSTDTSTAIEGIEPVAIEMDMNVSRFGLPFHQ